MTGDSGVTRTSSPTSGPDVGTAGQADVTLQTHDGGGTWVAPASGSWTMKSARHATVGPFTRRRRPGRERRLTVAGHRDPCPPHHAPSAPDPIATSDSGVGNNITNATTPTFNGTAKALPVTLYDGATNVGTGTPRRPGMDNHHLGPGERNPRITAETTDAAGNVSTASGPLSVTIDDTPAPHRRLWIIAASDTGTSYADNITSVTTPTFTGTAETGSSVTLFDGTTAIGTGVATAGRWTITASTLAAGTHNISARTMDLAGNVSATSTALGVSIDTGCAAPAVPTLIACSDSGVKHGQHHQRRHADLHRHCSRGR